MFSPDAVTHCSYDQQPAGADVATAVTAVEHGDAVEDMAAGVGSIGDPAAITEPAPDYSSWILQLHHLA